MGLANLRCLLGLNWKKLPIAAKLSLATTTVILMAVANFTLLSLHFQQANLREELQIRAESVLNTISIVSTDALLRKDYSSLEKITRNLEASNLVVAAKIYDRDSRTIVTEQTATNNNKIKLVNNVSYNQNLDLNNLAKQLLFEPNAVFIWESDRLIAGVALTNKDRTLGALSISLSTIPLQRAIEVLTYRYLGIACIVAFIATLLAFLLIHLITAPLKQMVLATQRLVNEYFGQKLSLKTYDEIAIVADVFKRINFHVDRLLQDLEQYADRAHDREQDSAILKAVPDLFLAIDREGVAIECTETANHNFSEFAKNIVGKKIAEVFPSEVALQFLEHMELAFQTNTIQVFEYELLLENTRCHFETRLVLDDRHEILAIVRDVTENRVVQEQLKYAKEAAEAANVAKSRFLANMSHELRTPLNGILGLSELLKVDAEEYGYTDFVPDLQQIQKSGLHLLTLIEDILDLSKIEAGSLDIEPKSFDLAALISEVSILVQPLMQKNNNHFKINISNSLGIVFSDRHKLKQVLLNLLSNSAKFTQNGTIVFSISRELRRDAEILKRSIFNSDTDLLQSTVVSSATSDLIVFSVADTGIGMTKEQIKKVFQPFIQADDSTTKKYGGTGLGLAICQSFCEMMGGKISVKSKPGCGSTFTIWLPATVMTTEAITC
jgi:signal transduction histidine kinase